MNTKTCFKCGVDKHLGDFYSHPAMKDGLLGKCKDCTKKDSIENRLRNIERYREYDRDRGKTEHRLERVRAYRKSHREIVRNSQKKYVERYPQKYKAHVMTSNAIRDEKIIPLPCLKCGEPVTEAHHPNYDEPMNIVWLCPTHHRQLHNQTKKESRAKI